MSVTKMSTRKHKNAGRLQGVSPTLLRRFTRLGELPNAMIQRVAQGSECQLIPAGNTIFTQDDDADAVYLLLDGKVELERREKGDVHRHRVVGPFMSFGDVALLGAADRYYTANTSAASVVIRTPLSLLREALASNPELALAWIHAVTIDMQRRERSMAESADLVLAGIDSPAFPDAA